MVLLLLMPLFAGHGGGDAGGAGEGKAQGEEGADLEEMEKRNRKAHMPKDARKKAETELKKLKLMSPMSAEATVVRNYIETLINLPWRKKSKISKDIAAAETILDADHYGLEKVKERILEYLAVRKLVSKLKGPILCFVGPPVTTEPERALKECPAIDFVVRREFDFATVEYAQGKPLEEILGVSYRKNGGVAHNPDRPAFRHGMSNNVTVCRGAESASRKLAGASPRKPPGKLAAGPSRAPAAARARAGLSAG